MGGRNEPVGGFEKGFGFRVGRNVPGFEQVICFVAEVDSRRFAQVVDGFHRRGKRLTFILIAAEHVVQVVVFSFKHGVGRVRGQRITVVDETKISVVRTDKINDCFRRDLAHLL